MPMEAASEGEIRTDERPALDISIRFWMSSWSCESRIHNQAADVQSVLGLWRRIWGSMSPLSQPIPGRPCAHARFLTATDSLRIVAGTARRPALLPQLFPIPDPVRHLVRQRESELMREHTHLPAMVGFVRKHVAQHFQANRPRPSPAVSAKRLDAASTTAERCGVHCARLSCRGTFRCGAVSLTHLERTLCMCVKIAAMVRVLPGGLALQAAGSRCSIRTWFMRSFAAKIWTAARPSCVRS